MLRILSLQEGFWQTVGLEKNIIEFGQGYTRKDYNSQNIEAQASDLAEFYEKEGLDNLPSTVGEIRNFIRKMSFIMS